MTRPAHHDQPEPTAQQLWEDRYRDAEHVWSGRPNAALVDTVHQLTPGKALDLGCGEGADAVWLATAGWRVTGVDISVTAIDRARRAAEHQHVGAATRFLSADLSRWNPDDGPYDLVNASFLHSPVKLPGAAILRRAAAHVSPGGHLLIVSHAAPPLWIDLTAHSGHRFILLLWRQ